MKMKFVLIMLLLLQAFIANSQLYKLSGRILNDKKEPLSLASVEIKELRKGSVSKDDGSYEFYLERGKYDIVVSLVGYKSKVVTVYINNEDFSETITLEDAESSNLSEVVLKVKSRDRAEELIRNVVRNKESILDAIFIYEVLGYGCVCKNT